MAETLEVAMPELAGDQDEVQLIPMTEAAQRLVITRRSALRRASPNNLESKLRGYMHDMQVYEGQKNTRMSFRMKEQEIEQKVLHIGIKDESMTPQQKIVFEKVGKEIQAYNENLPIGKAPLKMKVTVVK